MSAADPRADALRSVTTIVTHADCPDGIASALILLDALPDAEVVFTTYNTEHYRNLPAAPGMLFCDITPPRERAQEFVAAGAFVRDHHRGAQDIVALFGERGVFADEPGVSGAMLAYRYWCDRYGVSFAGGFGQVQDNWFKLAELAGIRDTWQRQHPRWREACAQAAALCFWPWSSLVRPADIVMTVRWQHHLQGLLQIGETLLARDEATARRCLSEASRVRVTGPSGALTCVVFEGGSHESSNVADLAGDADLVMAWHYRREGGRFLLDVSCRSRGAFKVVDLAKHYGGGGHDRAAGFTVPVERGDLQPVAHLEWLVKSFLWSRST